MKLSLIKENNEYYFFFANFYITGFVIKVQGNQIHINNGTMFTSNYEPTAYDEAYLDASHIVGFAST